MNHEDHKIIAAIYHGAETRRQMMLRVHSGSFESNEYFKLTRELLELQVHGIVGSRYKFNQYSAKVLTWHLTMKGIELFELTEEK